MSNANLSFSQQGLILLKRDEGVIEGLYDDASNYCTSGVGHLVHTKDKWASFLLAAVGADAAWKRLIAQSGRTRYLPQATAFNPEFSKMKVAAVSLAKEKIAQARLKTEYSKLQPTQSAEIDALAVAAVEAEAAALAQPIDVALRADLLPFERSVRQGVTVTLSQDEFDALVSFSFNVGAGAFAGSTLLTRINTDKHLSGTRKEREAAIDEVSKQFARWNRSAGRVLPGLTARRASEADRFLARARAALATQPVTR
jgi:GH24 family phage-related lysozyme (muramidase)